MVIKCYKLLVFPEDRSKMIQTSLLQGRKLVFQAPMNCRVYVTWGWLTPDQF